MVNSTKGEAPAQQVAQPNSKHNRGDVRGILTMTVRTGNMAHATGLKGVGPGLEVIEIPGFAGYPLGQSPK